MKTKIVAYHILKKIDDKKWFSRKLKTLGEAEREAKSAIKEHGFDSVKICRFRLHESDHFSLYGIPLRSWSGDGFNKTIYKKK